MTEQKQPIGYLFESIAIYDQSTVSQFVDNLIPEQAFYVITQAVQMAYSKNIYSLQESEILSKSLRILTEPKKETPTEE
jgi:ribosomal protein S3AE